MRTDLLRERTASKDAGFDASVPTALVQPKRGALRAARLAARRAVMGLWRLYYVRARGMDIDPSAWFSLKAHFDRTHRSEVRLDRLERQFHLVSPPLQYFVVT